MLFLLQTRKKGKKEVSCFCDAEWAFHVSDSACVCEAGGQSGERDHIRCSGTISIAGEYEGGGATAARCTRAEKGGGAGREVDANTSGTTSAWVAGRYAGGFAAGGLVDVTRLR